MKDGRNIIIGALLIAVITMAVGYSAFATQLEINGNAEIVGEWNVEITKIEATTVTGQADAGTPTFTKTTAEFDADLKQPGDSVVYTITVENKGSIDATLANYTMTPQADGSPAILYTYTEPAEDLAAGGTTTFTVTVTYDANITEVPTITTKTIEGLVEYEQAA